MSVVLTGFGALWITLVAAIVVIWSRLPHKHQPRRRRFGPRVAHRRHFRCGTGFQPVMDRWDLNPLRRN